MRLSISSWHQLTNPLSSRTQTNKNKPTSKQIHRPLDFLRQSFPDALALEERRLALSSSILKDLEANVEEAVGARSWLDVTTVLPPALSTGAFSNEWLWLWLWRVLSFMILNII